MSDGTKLSQLPSAQNLADTDLMYAVEDDTSAKATVGYLRSVFVGAETTAREAADTALGGRIDGKQDTLTFDNAPTENSNNPVKSGGIYTALADKANTSDLATVATSGSYNDLSNTPTIPSDADDISYDNTESGLTADDVQGAIDEVNGNIVDVEANPSGTATGELETIRVGSTIYNIVGGETIYGEASGAIASFTDGSANPLKSLVVDINPIQAGSGTPSPSNIRPISGWDEMNVTRCGKNLYSATLADYSSEQIVEVGLATFYPVKVPYGTYTISTNAPTGYIWAGYNIYDSTTLPRVYEGNPNTITTDIIWVGLLTSDMSSAYAYNIMINQGSTPSSYEPYNGHTYTIDLGQTVYGGKLDVTTGELTVTDGYIASYNGETLPSTWISDRDVYAPNTSPTTGAEVVYKLSTPTEVTLTPTEVASLLGKNNIWADSGDSDVVYVRDLNLAFNELWNKVNS